MIEVMQQQEEISSYNLVILLYEELLFLHSPLLRFEYQSDQVQRFTVYGKDRKLLIEKRLNATGEKWKVIEGAATERKNIKDVTYALFRIFGEIDEYMEHRHKFRDPL
jgi:hypothetical protein